MSVSENVTGVLVAGLKERLDRHEKASVREHGELWDAITSLRKRPPAWCTAVISVLTFFLGVSVTLIAVLIRSYL